MPSFAKTVLLFAVTMYALVSSTASPAQVTEHSAARSIGTISVATLSVPGKAWKHFEKARHAAHEQNEQACMQEIQKALELAPRFAEAYLLRADREVTAGHPQAAVSDVLMAQSIDPSIPWSKTVLAAAYNGLARYSDALLLLNNLPGREADSWQAKYEMARADVGRGDVEAALRWSAAALTAAPPAFVDVHLLRANALQLAHRWQEATEQMEAYLASSGPQIHRNQVLSALEHTRMMAEKGDGPAPQP